MEPPLVSSFDILFFLSLVLIFIFIIGAILRTQGLEMNSPSIVRMEQPSVAQVKFHKVGIPFFCNITTNQDNGLKIEINMEENCIFQSFWFVSMDKFMQSLSLPWSQFKDIMDTFALESEKPTDKRFLQADKSPHTIDIGDISDVSSLGPPPRLKFPLVILLMREINQPEDNNSEVGALISIVHIKDEYCPMPSTILYNYVKQYSGPVVLMKRLYTQTSEADISTLTSNEATEMSPISNERNALMCDEGACVICRVTPPTRALLPCRHVCVCALCFGSLRICPLCRSPIESYFVTRSEDGLVEDDDGRGTEKSIFDGFLSYFYSWFS